MKLSEFVKLVSTMNPDAELQAFDMYTGNNEPVTGVLSNSQTVIVVTDAIEFEED